MTTITLYTGGGVSLSPQAAEGRRVSGYVRLVADECRGITNGTAVVTCIDVLAADVVAWTNCDAPPEEPEEVPT